MNNLNFKVILTSLLLLVSAPNITWANINTKTQNEPIHIESDHVTFMQETGKIIYQGHVVVHSGDKILKANEVTVKRDENQKITSILATGHPAKFSTLMQNSAERLYAHAQNIDYDPSLSLLILTGKAKLEHQQDTFEGPILRYTLKEQKIEAITSNNQRPKMVIMPKTSPKKGDS